MTDNIAHDLRSPMTRIRGIAKTSRNEELERSGDRDTLDIIIAECDRLTGMIDTMLAIAVAKAKGVELFAILAADKGLAMRIELPASPLHVYGDARQFQRVVANLLDNAVEFTDTGAIDVSLAAVGVDVVLTVADTGAGIKEADLHQVCRKFFRGDSARPSPGNGLGLSYVQAVVGTHHGTPDIASSPDRGAVFTATLPLADSLAPARI